MDHRPIGVFDSGLGGLTAVRELRRLLPGEDIIYFGDTGRVPYGGRSPEAIVHYARQDVAFLRTFDLKAIVVACGTVSTTALDVLVRENDIPVWGVVEPAARAAARGNKKTPPTGEEGKSGEEGIKGGTSVKASRGAGWDKRCGARRFHRGSSPCPPGTPAGSPDSGAAGG